MMKAYTQFLGTLANEKRIQILLALNETKMCVSNLIEKTSLNQTTISHNLKRLEICGFVNFEQKGKFRIYSVNKKTIKPLLVLIEKHMRTYCCHVIENDKISNKYRSTKLK